MFSQAGVSQLILWPKVSEVQTVAPFLNVCEKILTPVSGSQNDAV